MKKVLVILAPGFEEVEALTPVDVLRRAGADVITAGTVDGVIVGRNDIKVLADESLDRVVDSEFDMIILPGGLGGTKNMMNDGRVKKIVEHHDEKVKYLAAICAAPTVLSTMGVTEGKKITSHPSVEAEFHHEDYRKDRVVVDGHIVTSRSPGTAMEFSFKLVELLFGKEKAVEVNAGVLAAI